MKENFLNEILNDAEGGCAGGILFFGIFIGIAVFVVLKEKISPIIAPVKVYLKSCFYYIVKNFKNKREQKKLNVAYTLVKKDLKHKANNYQNTVWNALADAYMEN